MRTGSLCLAAAVLALAGAARRSYCFSPEEAFERGNALYAEGRYEEALKAYLGILEAGWEAPEVYFNISDCYVRTGRLGHALLMCRKALRLAPGDEDVRANLEYIRSVLREGVPDSRESRLIRATLGLYESLSTDRLALAGSALLFALFGVLSFRAVKGGGPNSVRAAVALGFALALTAGAAVSKALQEERRVEAVILVPSAEVRSGPGEEFVVETTLGEGAEVRVKRSGEEWTEIALGPQLTGWVRTEQLGII